jgi:8-oxo-dGTP diphosphatase
MFSFSRFTLYVLLSRCIFIIMSPAIRVSAGILTRNGQVLICQRRPGDLHALKWEFPGGKVQDGEDTTTCLRRELGEELGIDATIGVELHRTTYTYPNGRTVLVTFLHVPLYAGEIENKQFQAVEWVEPTHLTAYDFLEGDVEFVAALAGGKWAQLFLDSRSPIPNP